MAVANIACKALSGVTNKHFYQYKVRKSLHNLSAIKFDIPKLELDINYLCNPVNKTEIETNIRNRKGVGNINRVLELHNKLQNETVGEEEKLNFLKEFNKEAFQIPNRSSPLVTQYGTEPHIMKVFGNKQTFNFKPKEFSDIATRLRMLRTENLSNFSGHKSYYFMGQLAELEHALVRFTVSGLLARGFQLVSVPDILPAQIIERCGMSIRGDRTQVYKLDSQLYSGDSCLSGTSEMALAAYMMNRELDEKELPLKLAAVSRCYRAETSKLAEEKGVYRVHQFTKVEMFGVTTRDRSEDFLQELQEFQEQTFASLGLHFHTLDMPPHELGAPAYRKFDVEAWMPGRKMYGEVSSCSDCTDYQARRLNIKYHLHKSRELVHAHTVNGTACAVPRTLIALLETHQQADKTVSIPPPLQRYMRDCTVIKCQDNIPAFKFIKSKQWEPKK